MRTRHRSGAGPAAAALVALSVLAGCGTDPVFAPPRSDGEAAAVAQAASDRPFLLLDLGRERLELYHGGALLREFPWTGGEIGLPRLAAGLGGRPVPGPGPWRPEKVTPGRRTETRVIRPSSPGAPDPTGAVDFVPPRPEELNPDPGRMRIRYADGLVLEVVADGVPPARWRWAAGTVIRVRMPRERLGSLFRALPDSTPLVVVAPPSVE